MLRAYSIQGNSQRLDGGAMFGNAPRAMWSQWLVPDEQGRVPLACRCLLIDDGTRKVLLETGIGAFFEPKLRARYGVVEPEHVLLKSLAALGLSDADIDVVILSHLHFDHAGGLLAEWREGEPASLLFPNAKYVVGRAALERAEAPHQRDRASFIPDLPRLLRQSGRLIVQDGETSSLLGPSYRFRESNGHTPGMLHTEVSGREQSLFFCADLVPGTAWVHVPITMGYDRYPERLIDEKQSWFEAFESRGTWLFFTHDPEVSAARLERDQRGRFRASGARAKLRGFDLDALESESSES